MRKAPKKCKATNTRSAVKYVRHGQPSSKARGERARFKIDLPELLFMSEDQVTKKLLVHEMLQKKKGTQCPRCKTGVLGPLKRFKKRGNLHA